MMTKLTLRNLRAHKRRLVGTFLAVVFGVAFFTGVFALTATINQTFDDLFSNGNRGTDAYVRSSNKIEVSGRGPGSFTQRGHIDSSTVDTVLGNPSVTPVQIADVIADVAQGLTAEQRSFVHLLAANERLAVLPEVAQLYEQLHHRETGVLDAHVSSAFPLTDVQVFEIRTTLEQKYGRRVQVTTDVAPELIGGVSIRIGDEVMDASVRGKLAQLAAALTH